MASCKGNKDLNLFLTNFPISTSTFPQLGVNESARRARHSKVLSRVTAIQANKLSMAGNLFALNTEKVQKIFNPYLKKQATVLDAQSASNKLFKRYSSIVAVLFLLGAISPVNSYASDGQYATGSDQISESIDFADTSLVADSEGYITKINPQTDSGDHSTMNDRLTHTVAQGETVSTIAASYGLKTSTILWENGLTNANSIKVGQALSIPPVDGITHKVTKGETVEKLAKSFGVSADSIKKQNSLVASALTEGQDIYIPGGKPIVETTNNTSSANVKGSTTIRNTPARVGTSTRVANVSVGNSGGAILPNSNTVPVGDKPLIEPTRGIVTQGYHRGHYAVDIADGSKPPIWSAAAGTVVKVSTGTYGGGYGNYVIVDHGNGTQTLYAHLDYVEVKQGDKVTQGQVLGRMGNTGRVFGRTGIHLHFEYRKNGVKLVPYQYY